MTECVERERDIDWRRYTSEKRKIENQGLSNEEYEKAIREICKKLGI